MRAGILKIIIITTFFIITPIYASTHKCCISFSAKGGTGTMEKMEVVKGATIKLNPCTYIKDGYYFLYWEDDFGNMYKDQDFIIVKTDIRLSAKWSKTGDNNDPQIIKANSDDKVLKRISEYQTLRGLDPTIRSNTWYNVGGELWYLIGADGLPVRGWYEDDGRWYYLDTDTCLMCVGWKVIDREYYYFAEKVVEAEMVFDKVAGQFVSNGNEKEIGQMYCDEYTPDGRYVNNSGVMVNQYR